MRLTQEQKATLDLIMRSPDRGEGWRTCASILFEKLIVPMPDELVEKDMEQRKCRLTEQGKTLVAWM